MNIRDRGGSCGCYSHNGLVRRGYEQLSLPGIDKAEALVDLDKVGSVSAVRRDETTFVFDDKLIDEQHRRFLNGVRVDEI